MKNLSSTHSRCNSPLPVTITTSMMISPTFFSKMPHIYMTLKNLVTIRPKFPSISPRNSTNPTPFPSDRRPNTITQQTISIYFTGVRSDSPNKHNPSFTNGPTLLVILMMALFLASITFLVNSSSLWYGKKTIATFFHTSANI